MYIMILPAESDCIDPTIVVESMSYLLKINEQY